MERTCVCVCVSRWTAADWTAHTWSFVCRSEGGGTIFSTYPYAGAPRAASSQPSTCFVIDSKYNFYYKGLELPWLSSQNKEEIKPKSPTDRPNQRDEAAKARLFLPHTHQPPLLLPSLSFCPHPPTLTRVEDDDDDPSWGCWVRGWGGAQGGTGRRRRLNSTSAGAGTGRTLSSLSLSLWTVGPQRPAPGERGLPR